MSKNKTITQSLLPVDTINCKQNHW